MSRAQQLPSKRTLRFAVLGTGKIARKVAPMIAAAEGCAVVAVASRELDRAKSFGDEHGWAACTWGELATPGDVRGERVDAVYLAGTTETHGVWSEKLLRAGRHVLCEKPLAWRRGDAERLYKVAEEHGRLLVEAFMTLHSPVVGEAAALARDPHEGIGRLRHIDASFDADICPEPPAESTRFSRRLGGGSLLDLGCYPLCWIRSLTGEEPIIDNVDVEMVDWHVDSDGDDAVDGAMVVSGSFPSGATFRFTCTMITNERVMYLRMVGDKAVAELPRFITPTSIELHDLSRADMPPDPPVRPPDGVYYTEQAAAFARAVSGEGDQVPSAEWSIAQADAIERIFGKAGIEPIEAF